MSERIPAEVFPPGEFIQEELNARGWMQEDLARIIGTTIARINEVIKGKRGITDETAVALGEAFGTGPEYWLRLDEAYRLSRGRSSGDAVARRARLYSIAPMRELIKRQWIEGSENLEVLEKRVCDFFEIDSISQEPSPYPHAARKPDYETITQMQRAWLFRARHLARAISAARFSSSTLSRILENLRPLLLSPEEIRCIPKVLAEGGIRLVVLETIPGTKIDGATFWLANDAPVIALSFRYDRIDWFWHTLMHEIRHVENRDGLKQHYPIDIRLVGKDAVSQDEKPEHERAADSFACEYLIPQSEVDDFISRVGPLYSKVKIAQFAARMQVHPGMVVGQLQHRGEIPWTHSREMLVAARSKMGDSALTEGWGQVIELGKAG